MFSSRCGGVSKPTLAKHVRRCKRLLGLYVERARLSFLFATVARHDGLESVQAQQDVVARRIDATHKVAGWDSYITCPDYRAACDARYDSDGAPNFLRVLPDDAFEIVLPFLAQVKHRQVVNGQAVCL